MTLRFRAFALPLLTCATLFAGCGGNQAVTDDVNLIGFNDYESVLGWQPDANAVTRDHAHSGKYAIMVGPGKDYALGYGLPIGKATSRKPRKIGISAWGYMSDAKSVARLNLQLYNPATGKEAFSDGIDFSSAIKTPKKWMEISKEVTLPENIDSNLELRVYLWRANAETPAYLDDMRITLVE